LNNENLTVAVGDEVDLIISHITEVGINVIINDIHKGLLYKDQVYDDIRTGDRMTGYIKAIRPDNKIDVTLGKPGYQKTEDESSKIMRLLQENDGYLPYHDKSEPEEIYSFFGMSKKTFKMTLGKLFKERKIELTKTGFKLNENN
jgi:predicted RNA-binding protein (virulence factor B family)